MAHYPDAKKPGPKDIPRIERPDFPAPPFAYSDLDRRRRWSESSKDFESDQLGDGSGDLSDQIDGDSERMVEEDPRLRKEKNELLKISTGIGKVFLKSVKEREKIRAWKMSHLDPRNASRNPSAKNELAHRLRYDNPVNACKHNYLE